MFLGERKSTLFGLPIVMHLGIIKIAYNRTASRCYEEDFSLDIH